MKILFRKYKIKNGHSYNPISQNLKKGFTIIEVIIGVTIFSIYFSALLLALINMVQLEIKAKERIYETMEKIDEISDQYYIHPEDY